MSKSKGNSAPLFRFAKRPLLGFLLLFAAQVLAAPAHPPLFPEGEPVDDPEGIIANMMPGSPAYGIAFSPDGRLLASASGDRTVRLWDPATGEALRTLAGHEGSVRSVAFSPDGRLLASASGDRTVRLWDPATGEALRTLAGHEGSVRSVAFSPDGRLLASASDDRTMRLWDPATGEALRTLAGHEGSVRSVAFSPDGRLLASASWDNTVRLWDPATGEALRTLAGHEDSVNSVAFSPDGRLLASASRDNTVRLWDPATGEALRTLAGHEGYVSSVAFSPDGRLLASASDDRTMRLWDPATGEALRTLAGHEGSVRSVAFSPDGRLLASASRDNTVRLWDPATGEALRTLAGHEGYVSSVAFSPDGRLLASASWDRTMRLWDPATGEALRTLAGHEGSVRSVAFSPDGRLLASASWDNTVRLWDPATGEALRTLAGHEDSVNSVAFSPDGRLLASASRDNTVRLWDPATGEALRTLAGHEGSVRSVAFSPDGRLLASASGDRTVRLWDPATGEALRTLAGHEGSVNSVAFSPDGRLLASASWDNTVRLWDPATGEALRTLAGHEGSVRSVAFSPDGRLLASASWDNTVRLWDPATGEALRTLAGHESYVSSVAFSPDGRLLASASWDNTVRLWDPAAGATGSILVGGKEGLWAACRVAERRCWRYDDGSLLAQKGDGGLIEPLPLPADTAPARLELEVAEPGEAGSQPVLSPGDGETASVALRVRNLTDEPAYWVRIHQARQPGDPLLFSPPQVRVLLGPGKTWEPTAGLSYLAAGPHPKGMAGKLQLRLEQAIGDPVTLDIPVRARAPELMLAREPEKVKGDVPSIALRVHNAGDQDLQEAEFRARISGIDKPLARVTEDSIAAGAELPLSFALPSGTELNADSRLTLEARELSYPRHEWSFKDQPIRLPTPPWQLWAGLATLLLALSVLLWYLRQYTHPLTRRLAAEPAALPRLGLEQLGKAQGLLRRTRRLDSLLSANGIHARWLDQALRFREGSAEDRVKWLAHRLGANWQRLEGLGTDGAIERFELSLGDDFPLNLKACPVVFPPADWPEKDVLTSLDTGGDQVSLILSGDAQQRAALSRRCRTPENWWVAPEDGELSELLLSPEPVETFARLIASYVKVARISPYQTRLGVRKDSAFFGRAQIISDILNRAPANYLLVGGRQLGKSSLLLALKRRYEVDDSVDCHYLSVGKARIESQLARALAMKANTPLDPLLERLGDVETGRRRLLLLDEADVFVQHDAEQGYACLNGFRSLSDEGRCQFILAGFWSLYRSASFDYHSPIKNFAETISVGALEPDACRDLVVRPMEALNLRYASEDLVERIVTQTGGRANLIAIICDQMLQGLGLEQRELSEADLARAVESRSLRSALEGWANLSGDEAADRLDRLIVYGLIGQDDFTLGDVLESRGGLGYETEPERVKESMTRLELAFILGRAQNRFRWQVPLWRALVLAEEPQLMLERELASR